MIIETILFFVGCFAAHYNDSSPNGFSGGSFAILWGLILLICISVYGTLVMRKYRDTLNVGIFLGMVAMMANMLFMIFCLFCALAANDDGDQHHLDRAVAAFTFFAFLNYVFLFIALFLYRAMLYDVEDGTVLHHLERKQGNPA